jgi:hypothetical protein
MSTSISICKKKKKKKKKKQKIVLAISEQLMMKFSIIFNLTTSKQYKKNNLKQKK